MICPGCGADTGVRPPGQARPNFPPTVSPTASAARIFYAGFWMRFVAWALDAVILTGVAFLVLGRLVSLVRVSGIFGALGSSDNLDNIDDWYKVLGLSASVMFFLGYLLLSWLYHALLESSSWQGTIGKRALGLIVTDTAGAKVTFGRASGRFFGRLVSSIIPFGIGYLLAGFTRQKQALHDLLSNCLVLRKTS